METCTEIIKNFCRLYPGRSTMCVTEKGPKYYETIQLYRAILDPTNRMDNDHITEEPTRKICIGEDYLKSVQKLQSFMIEYKPKNPLNSASHQLREIWTEWQCWKLSTKDAPLRRKVEEVIKTTKALEAHGQKYNNERTKYRIGRYLDHLIKYLEKAKRAERKKSNYTDEEEEALNNKTFLTTHSKQKTENKGLTDTHEDSDYSGCSYEISCTSNTSSESDQEAETYYSKHTKYYSESALETSEGSLTEEDFDDSELEDPDALEAILQGTESSDYTSEAESINIGKNGTSPVEELRKVNGQEYRGLIDTGSTSTFVTKAVAEQSTLTTKEVPSLPSFTGLNNTVVGSPFAETNIYLECPNNSGKMIGVLTHAYIIDRLSKTDHLDVLVGINALIATKQCVDPASGRSTKPQESTIGNYLVGEDENTDLSHAVTKKSTYHEVDKGAPQSVRLGKDLTEYEQGVFKALILSQLNAFSMSSEDLGRTDLFTHKIVLTDTRPIKQQPYRTPEKMKAEIDKQVTSMLKLGVILPAILCVFLLLLLMQCLYTCVCQLFDNPNSLIYDQSFLVFDFWPIFLVLFYAKHRSLLFGDKYSSLLV